METRLLIIVIVGLFCIVAYLCVLTIIYYNKCRTVERFLENALNRNDNLIAYIKDLEEHIQELKEDQYDTVNSNPEQ